MDSLLFDIPCRTPTLTKPSTQPNTSVKVISKNKKRKPEDTLNSNSKKLKKNKEIPVSNHTTISNSLFHPPSSSPSLLKYFHKDSDVKQSAPQLMETKLDCYYWVNKPLPDEDWKVMAAPTTKDFSGEFVEPYPIHIEEDIRVGVPRFFGCQKYGKPCINNTTEGDPMNPDIHFTWKLQNTPQKPQEDAVKAWLKNNGEGVLCLPCGAGKTVIAVYLALLKHRRTLILVHNEGLMYQWIERIQMICPQAKIGIIQQDKCQIASMDFIIGMVQTVRATNNNLDSVGMVIVDECHHIAAKTFSQSVLKTKCRYVLGLSATPTRKDGLTYVIHWLLGPLIFETKRRDIIPQEITQIEYSAGNQKVVTYKNGMIGLPVMTNRMLKDQKRNQLVHYCMEKLINNSGIQKMLVLSARREHLKDLFELYSKKYDCGLYIGQMKKNDLENATTKRIIFASYNMAQEFLDIGGLNGMVLATPPPSNIEQIIGRLRENLNAAYSGCKTMNEDEDYEEELEYCLEAVQLPLDLIHLCIKYTKTPIDRQRIVYDIVDTFSIFLGMSWSRFKKYQELGYKVKRVSEEQFMGITTIIPESSPVPALMRFF